MINTYFTKNLLDINFDILNRGDVIITTISTNVAYCQTQYLYSGKIDFLYTFKEYVIYFLTKYDNCEMLRFPTSSQYKTCKFIKLNNNFYPFDSKENYQLFDFMKITNVEEIDDIKYYISSIYFRGFEIELNINDENIILQYNVFFNKKNISHEHRVVFKKYNKAYIVNNFKEFIGILNKEVKEDEKLKLEKFLNFLKIFDLSIYDFLFNKQANSDFNKYFKGLRRHNFLKPFVTLSDIDFYRELFSEDIIGIKNNVKVEQDNYKDEYSIAKAIATKNNNIIDAINGKTSCEILYEDMEGKILSLNYDEIYVIKKMGYYIITSDDNEKQLLNNRRLVMERLMENV